MILLHVALSFYAQKVTIQGVLADSLQQPLISATVVLLHPQDSTMEYFCITSATGKFKIKGIKRGKYIFQASYLGYQSIYNSIDLTDANEQLSMGTLVLQAEQKVLGEVVVNGERIPILIKKDTVEYNASSFKVKPNSSVEDLLKKLPGVEVKKDGTIRAQGETVRSIMVDGKEFFGNDPKIASQNLPADAVDKVQVYDKKSEVAAFTGVDDGVRNKTINLELKDGKKKGYFGNVAVGYGTDNRFESKANVNRFGKKSQLSFLGRANNINEQGFSFNDYLTFAGGLQNVMSEGGGAITLGGNNGLLPFDTGQPNYGFANSGSGGVNFNYDFPKKIEFTGSYFFNRLKKTEEVESVRQNFLDENIFPSEQMKNQTKINNNHRLNMKFRSKIKTNQILTLRTNFSKSGGTFRQVLNNRVYQVNQSLQNSNWSKNGYKNESWKASANLSYLLKFKKKGRSLATNLAAGAQANQQTNSIESINSFLLDEPSRTFSDSLNQLQNQDGNQLDYAFRLTFTEPIGKKKYLQLRYNRRNYSNKLTKDFFDIKNEVQNRNNILSKTYERDYTYDRT
ncbi:MAG TPA: TonB-dependent receptor, partial [Phaeodactylibacter sp.]|nr:TonB-dependent receptor [Phaeodactylibacter sp.]